MTKLRLNHSRVTIFVMTGTARQVRRPGLRIRMTLLVVLACAGGVFPCMIVSLLCTKDVMMVIGRILTVVL